MMETERTIVVLGASGLIGHAVATALASNGWRLSAVARSFSAAQRAALGNDSLTIPVLSLDSGRLAGIFRDKNVDIVVNCIGVLQGGGSGGVDDVHCAFIERLVAAIKQASRPVLLIHLSIPGLEEDDRTAFSRTKRRAEGLITKSSLPFVILRPGFVIAPSAYGGSALVRALAALPISLPETVSNRPIAATAVSDIAKTIDHVALAWRAGVGGQGAVWDVLERRPSTFGGVVASFRHHFGGDTPRFALPSFLLDLGAVCGDFAGRLGWSPPIRSTALVELRRGVTGDPEPWIAATGIEPASLAEALAQVPSTVQERWFARLYLAKALVIGALAAFWIASGGAALTFGFDAAAGVLAASGFPPWLSPAVVVATSFADLAVGLSIAIRKTCRQGLQAAILLSLLYLAGATVFAHSLWADPLGPLVKIAPIIALTLVALAIMEER